MSKELEYIQRHIDIVKQQIKGSKMKIIVTDTITKHQYDYYENELQTLESIEKALLRLEAIDNAASSEALKKLEMLSDCAEAMKEAPSSNWIEYADNEAELDYQLWRAYEDLKQALLKAEKEHNSVNLLMQELDCKDFAELRKYARCGYQTFRNAKGANYDNIIIDEAQEPKQYLKWEDLKFSYGTKTQKVRMVDTIYKIVYANYDNTKEVQLLSEDEKCYYIGFTGNYKDNVQLFNDLHLERVEE